MVLTATNGPDALDMLKGNDVSVVVSDNVMPNMLGTQFLDEASGAGTRHRQENCGRAQWQHQCRKQSRLRHDIFYHPARGGDGRDRGKPEPAGN